MVAEFPGCLWLPMVAATRKPGNQRLSATFTHVRLNLAEEPARVNRGKLTSTFDGSGSFESHYGSESCGVRTVIIATYTTQYKEGNSESIYFCRC